MHARHWILFSFLVLCSATVALAQSSEGDLTLGGRQARASAFPLPPGVFGSSENGYIGIYADQAGTQPCIQLPSVGTFYVIATTGGGTSTGLTGAEFRIQSNNVSQYFFITTASPDATVVLGDPFATGVNIAFPTCQGTQAGDKILLFTVTAIPTSGGPIDFYVMPRNPPTNPEFACPLFTLCDVPVFSKVCMQTCDMDGMESGFKAQLNTPVCDPDLGPCPGSVCPQACVAFDAQVPDSICEGSSFTVNVVATNCAADPESLYVDIDGVPAGAFGLVPPGGSVTASRIIPGGPCPNGRVAVSLRVRGVIPGCPPATLMQEYSVACHDCGGQGPDCSNAEPTVATLWPPNHKLTTVGITGVTTQDGHPAAIQITGVTADEIVNGLGDGDTCPDAILGGSSVQLRAERSGTANGRVYTVHFTATDVAGNACRGAVTVCVPHDQGAGSVCTDDGWDYDVTTCETSPAPLAPRGLQMARDARTGLGLTFTLERGGPVELTVFDIAGRAVRTLASGSYSAGVHTIHWNGLDGDGRPVANGVYFFRLRTEGETQSVKGVWMR